MAYATVDELARALRVRVTAENTPGLTACLDAAAAEIDHEIDVDPGAVAPSAAWYFSAEIDPADPGPGYVRRDRTTAAPTQALYLDPIDADGVDHYADALRMEVGDLVEMRDVGGTKADVYTLTAVPIDRIGWVEYPVNLTRQTPTLLDPVEGDTLTLAYLRPTQPLAQGAALLNRVNILRGVEWVKANDAAFGVIGFDETGALQAPRDGFNRHAYTLTPVKAHWGLA